MTIVGVLNGYYRSGTTILYELLREGWKDGLVLYEPLHPEFFRKVPLNEYEPMHGTSPWSEYKKLKNWEDIVELQYTQFAKYRVKYMIDHAIFVIDFTPLTYDDFRIAWDYLKVYDEIDENIILQTNRLHYFPKYYRRIHIIRNIGDTFISHMGTPTRKKIIKWMLKIHPKLVEWYYNYTPDGFRLFYVKDNYNKIIRVFEYRDLPEDIPNMKKFKIVYDTLNDIAKKHYDNIITYEDFVRDPIRTLEYIEDKFGIELKNKEELARRVRNCNRKKAEYFRKRFEKL